jgi:hypothetical protein
MHHPKPTLAERIDIPRAFIEVLHGLKQTNRASIKRNPKQFRAGGSWRFTNVSNAFGCAICVGLTDSA